MHSSISSSEAHPRHGPAERLLAFAVSLCLTLVLFAGASKWLVRNQVLPQDTRQAHLHLLETAQVPHAAFGDSHVARGFDAPGGIVNLAFPSENIDAMSAKVVAYFGEQEPGRVILQADPHQFANYRLRRPGAWHGESGGTAAFHVMAPRHRAWLLAYWDSALRNGGTLKSKVGMTAQGALLSQGDLSQIPPRKRMLEARERLLTHRPARAEARAGAQALYSALIHDLAARGAEICLVTFPVSAAYAQAEDGAHEELIAFFAGEAARRGARYVDARAMVRDPGLFRDVDHLNVAGARWFSPRILSRCFPG